MQLYEITDTYKEFIRMVEDEEIPQEAIQDTLEGLTGLFEDKADAIACSMKNLKSEAEAIKAEETALYERRKVKENAISRLKETLFRQMTETGIEKVETPRNKISLRNNAPSVFISDEFAFLEWAKAQHDEYLTYKEPSINKTAIKDALKSGEEIQGAELRVNRSLTMK